MQWLINPTVGGNIFSFKENFNSWEGLGYDLGRVQRLVIRTDSFSFEAIQDVRDYSRRTSQLFLDSTLVDRNLLRCYNNGNWGFDLSPVLGHNYVKGLGKNMGLKIVYAKGVNVIPKLVLPPSFNPTYENTLSITTSSARRCEIPFRTIMDKKFCGKFVSANFPQCVYLLQEGEIYIEDEEYNIYLKKKNGNIEIAQIQLKDS